MLKYIIMFVPSCKVLNELSKNVPVALVQTSLKPEQADLSSSINFEFVMELTQRRCAGFFLQSQLSDFICSDICPSVLQSVYDRLALWPSRSDPTVYMAFSLNYSYEKRRITRCGNLLHPSLNSPNHWSCRIQQRQGHFLAGNKSDQY